MASGLLELQNFTPYQDCLSDELHGRLDGARHITDSTLGLELFEMPPLCLTQTHSKHTKLVGSLQGTAWALPLRGFLRCVLLWRFLCFAQSPLH